MSDDPKPAEAPAIDDGGVEDPSKPGDQPAPVEEPPGTGEPPTKEPPAGPDEVDPPLRDPRLPDQPTRKNVD